jgi:carbon starvation protein CstA
MVNSQILKRVLLIIGLLIISTKGANADGEVYSLVTLLPWWLVYILTTTLVLTASWLGIKLAIIRKQKRGEDHEGSVNSVVGALMGLLAFILAFTFGVTTNKFDSRKELLLEEVTAIETLYLRAGLIPEPHCSEVRALVKQYVNIRIDLAQHPNHAREAIIEAESLQKKMWKHAEALPNLNLKHSDVVSLFTESLNHVIELQTKRITVTTMHQLPPALWFSLYIITFLSMMGIGYLFGMAAKANWTLLTILSLAFSVVIILIADLDNSNTGQQGIIRLNTQPMIQLEQRMNVIAK